MSDTDFVCTFCGKTRREVGKLISGPRVFICDECVELCAQILVEEKEKGNPKLQLLSEQTSTLGTVREEIDAAERRARELERTILDVARTVARVLPTPLAYRCVWCEATHDDIEATRQHVATCDKHPAVLKLREIEAKKPRRRAAR